MADPDLAAIIDCYGYPPDWYRPNSFESLVHIILEQQVSIASARASLEKLRLLVGPVESVDPESVIEVTDHEFRLATVSRQKARYIRLLAAEIISGRLDLAELATMPDTAIRIRLLELKGFGNWTIDIYLLLVLRRPDVFPVGDIAATNALKAVKQLATGTTSNELVAAADQWRPYRSTATLLLWHYYLASRGRS